MNTTGKPRRVIILGALSTIAEALARQLAARGAEIVLAGRRKDALEHIASDVEARGATKAIAWPIDLAGGSDTEKTFDAMVEALGGRVDAVVVIYGFLGDQRMAEMDMAEMDRIIAINFSSAARWCAAAASVLESQKCGVLLGISSVAGDRGRQSNYVYGAAKAGLTVLLQGIAHRLAPSGARAIAVKLGFVDTAMTAHIKKGGPLWAKPEAVARQLVGLIDKPGKPVVYLPWFWRPIMSVIRALPTPVIHKTGL
ncbi:MAG: SDR family NAD(P)-dependent oxidoreductase [Hyphomicrobiaceae bacterium]